jgi:toxin CptA
MDAIELKPSRWLGLLLLAMACAAGLAIALADLPAVLKGILVAAVAVATGIALARQRRDPPRLAIDRDGRLWAKESQGDWVAAAVSPASFASPGLCVLDLDLAGRRRVLTLLPDSTDAGAWRRLRVSLRWGPRTRSDTPSRDAG